MTRYGESGRNFQRNNSRNSGATDALALKVPFDTYNVMYQYCKKYGCRKIEALLIATTSRTPVIEENITKLAEALAVPIYVIVHRVKDESLKLPVTLFMREPGKELVQVPDLTRWGSIAKALKEVHKEHEKTSRRCAGGYEDAWLSAGQGKSNTPKDDFSMSNMLRVIPGVRHLDIDMGMSCPRCHVTQVIVEASSDGMKGTKLENKAKATSMSSAISSVIGSDTVLLQHHVGDSKHEEPIEMTLFKGGKKKDQVVARTWEEAVSAFESLFESHVCGDFSYSDSDNVTG